MRNRVIAATLCLVLAAACSRVPQPGAAARTSSASGMGMDAFGHTRMSEKRDAVPPDEMAHTQRLLRSLAKRSSRL